MNAPIDPGALQRHYRRFRVADRLLFTGHSHQAWPDVTEAAHARAWSDAADLVDAKWDRAEAEASLVRDGFARLLGDDDRGCITLAPNTHELLVRVLSGLDWSARRRIVTTDGEFHSARRQLDRLAEVGVEVVKVATEPVDDLAERLTAHVDDGCAMVLVSKVLFESGYILSDLEAVAATARRHGSVFVVDAYHAVNVLDWTLADDDLADAFVLGGGYKYVQAGEGNCFLRWPVDTGLTPVDTGWYAEFGDLATAPGRTVAFSRGPERFAGATYDPTSHYRGAAAMGFFSDHDLVPGRLRQLSQHQVGRLRAGIQALEADPSVLQVPDVPLARLGGFLALVSDDAATVCAQLADRGVHADHRGRVLRLGPAPYVTDTQIDDAVGALGEVLRAR